MTDDDQQGNNYPRIGRLHIK
ncbi:protein of unknown function [Streptantibioticus cattleyicolor NRRL 8057 = DSM 46488]|nr:protein of unknown function [Streptantibioticus cattleyicolor NRRL 8057 = DSM 46488]